MKITAKAQHYLRSAWYYDKKSNFLNDKIAVLGCGGGKSVIIATIARASTDNGARVLFLVHRRELVEQIKRTMHRQGVDPDLCSVMMVQTASRRLRSLVPPVNEAKAVLGVRGNE